MKKTLRTVLALTLVFAMMLSLAGFANARVSITYGSSYGKYVRCALQSRSKAGYVNILTYNCSFNGKVQRNSIYMTDQYGNYIWSEYGAISMNGSRTFTLGNDHNVYRIYVRDNYGNGTAYFTNYGNVSLKVNG